MKVGAPKIAKTCACGCGRVVSHGATYVRGHWSRTPEGRAKASESGHKSAARHISIVPKPGELTSPPTEQAIVSMVSEGRWTDDDVATMVRFVGVDDETIGRLIDLMDYIGKLKGEPR